LVAEQSKEALLASYGLSEADRVGGGMEAAVYRHGADVIKLYTASDQLLTNLHELRAFYAALTPAALPYALPAIKQIVRKGAYIVTREPFLAGEPFTARIAATAPADLDQLFSRYVAAVHALSQLEMPPAARRYKLFDPAQLSLRAGGDWHAFLKRWLDAQLKDVAPYFERDVHAFGGKLAIMEAVLAQPYRGEYRVVHGDICPGNLLVDGEGQIGALLDFGLFTLYGDPLFDAATAWVFFDMYDELAADVRRRLLPFVLRQYGTASYGRLIRYVLLYSLLAANTYAPDCSDGHYQWCVSNLNTAAYWASIE
jgi:aminoglycoside phosphotransferase (APT) family kinase protein